VTEYGASPSVRRSALSGLPGTGEQNERRPRRRGLHRVRRLRLGVGEQEAMGPPAQRAARRDHLESMPVKGVFVGLEAEIELAAGGGAKKPKR